jgi:hypothetical protein
MTTDQLSTQSETPDRRGGTDRRASDRRVLRCVLPVGQRSSDDRRACEKAAERCGGRPQKTITMDLDYPRSRSSG